MCITFLFADFVLFFFLKKDETVSILKQAQITLMLMAVQEYNLIHLNTILQRRSKENEHRFIVIPAVTI